MYYMIVGTDVAESLKRRQSVYSEHLARLQALTDQGRLLLAGPNPIDEGAVVGSGFSGSLIVAEFSSLAEAKEWANEDPYIRAGVYESVIVKPFKKVLPYNGCE